MLYKCLNIFLTMVAAGVKIDDDDRLAFLQVIPVELAGTITQSHIEWRYIFRHNKWLLGKTKAGKQYAYHQQQKIFNGLLVYLHTIVLLLVTIYRLQYFSSDIFIAVGDIFNWVGCTVLLHKKMFQAC